MSYGSGINKPKEKDTKAGNKWEAMVHAQVLCPGPLSGL